MWRYGSIEPRQTVGRPLRRRSRAGVRRGPEAQVCFRGVGPKPWGTLFPLDRIADRRLQPAPPGGVRFFKGLPGERAEPANCLVDRLIAPVHEIRLPISEVSPQALFAVVEDVGADPADPRFVDTIADGVRIREAWRGPGAPLGGAWLMPGGGPGRAAHCRDTQLRLPLVDGELAQENSELCETAAP